MTNLSQYLDDRLEEWADWYNKFSDGGMGYPSVTIEGRLMEMGVIIRVSGSKAGIPENHDAEEMERWICSMYKWKPKLALSVRARYQGDIYKIVNNVLHRVRRLSRISSMGEVAKNMEISVKVLECNLREAKDYLAGHYLETLERKRKAA